MLFPWHKSLKRINELFRRRLRTGARPRPYRLRLEPLEDRLLLSIFTVTSAGDDTNADDGTTSLREAILRVNNDTTPDRINFNILGAGVQTISPEPSSVRGPTSARRPRS